MIDLTRIRSIKTLEAMKNDLTNFINNKLILKIYIEDYDWCNEDYLYDIEQSKILIERIDYKIKKY